MSTVSVPMAAARDGMVSHTAMDPVVATTSIEATVGSATGDVVSRASTPMTATTDGAVVHSTLDPVLPTASLVTSIETTTAPVSPKSTESYTSTVSMGKTEVSDASALFPTTHLVATLGTTGSTVSTRAVDPLSATTDSPTATTFTAVPVESNPYVPDITSFITAGSSDSLEPSVKLRTGGSLHSTSGATSLSAVTKNTRYITPSTATADVADGRRDLAPDDQPFILYFAGTPILGSGITTESDATLNFTIENHLRGLDVDTRQTEINIDRENRDLDVADEQHHFELVTE